MKEPQTFTGERADAISPRLTIGGLVHPCWSSRGVLLFLIQPRILSIRSAEPVPCHGNQCINQSQAVQRTLPGSMTWGATLAVVYSVPGCQASRAGSISLALRAGDYRYSRSPEMGCLSRKGGRR